MEAKIKALKSSANTYMEKVGEILELSKEFEKRPAPGKAAKALHGKIQPIGTGKIQIYHAEKSAV
jgi:hypothetical protein